MTAVRRGDVCIVHLDPARGTEQRGVRPCVVIQNDVSNQTSSVTIVAAITSAPQKRARLTDVWVKPGTSGLVRDSRVLLNQVRTVDMGRVGAHLGRLTDEQMAQVDEALQLSLGLVPI